MFHLESIMEIFNIETSLTFLDSLKVLFSLCMYDMVKSGESKTRISVTEKISWVGRKDAVLEWILRFNRDYFTMIHPFIHVRYKVCSVKL